MSPPIVTELAQTTVLGYRIFSANPDRQAGKSGSVRAVAIRLWRSPGPSRLVQKTLVADASVNDRPVSPGLDQLLEEEDVLLRVSRWYREALSYLRSARSIAPR